MGYYALIRFGLAVVAALLIAATAATVLDLLRTHANKRQTRMHRRRSSSEGATEGATKVWP